MFTAKLMKGINKPEKLNFNPTCVIIIIIVIIKAKLMNLTHLFLYNVSCYKTSKGQNLNPPTCFHCLVMADVPKRTLPFQVSKVKSNTACRLSKFTRTAAPMPAGLQSSSSPPGGTE